MGQITLGDKLTIVGTGARQLTVARNQAGERVFETLNSTSTGTITGITISGGNVPTAGGAIYFRSLGNWTLLEVAVRGNQSGGSGGGIYNEGTLTIRSAIFEFNSSSIGGCIGSELGTVNISNTTLANCTASGGGGIDVSSGTVVLNNVTISGSSGNGGGIRAGGTGIVRMRNTLVSDNNCIGCGNDENDDVAGVGRFVSNGNNLIRATPTAGTGFTDGVLGDKVGVDPQTFDSANNGGVVDTLAFLPTSPARDAGNNCVTDLNCPSDNPSAALTTDARGTGFSRLVGANVDIGAYELLPPTAAPVFISGRVVDNYGRAISGAIVSAQGFDGTSVSVRTNTFGYFRIEGFEAGDSVILQATSRRYSFATQVLNLGDSVNDLLLIGTLR